MKYRNTFRFRFTVLFLIVLAVVYAGTYLVFRQFLAPYALEKKSDLMESVCLDLLEMDAGTNDRIKGVTSFAELFQEEEAYYQEYLDFIKEQYGISVYMETTFQRVHPAYGSQLQTLRIASRDVDADYMKSRLNNLKRTYAMQSRREDSNTIVTKENYTIRYNAESSSDNNHIDGWGGADGFQFLVSMTVADVRNNIKIVQSFYIYVGLGGFLIGGILIFLVMRRATRSVTRLTDISNQMMEMDFSAKYIGNSKDEIGVLGQNMNALSEKLEHTLLELKTANLELMNDIEKKNEIEQQRTEFISNVSHELKTPIALIQGYAEGLSEGVTDDPESVRDYCNVIVDEAQKMNRMVRQLLSLNQIEAGQNMLDISRFDITELINGVVGAQEIELTKKKALVIVRQHDPVFVMGDEYRIEEVLTNYISNAINHLAGKREIVIDTTTKDGVVRVSVSNTGKQIPEEEIDRIWEKFYKVDKARTREYGGHGIGLSIVKAIMDRHHGKCGAYNTDTGVVFWFELPCG
ncbi:MAG: HAMP domain-containing protein [Lachnospiraceae bacterium]|nr:HAMP domain-containing protein [Lachnospiraceae bacterium]